MGAAILTVVLAFTGYAVTYLNNLRLAQRQERLARVNRQLAELYGPLLALTEANSRLFTAFTERHPRADGRSPLQHGPDAEPLTEREAAEWHRWLTAVFLPNHRAVREILTTKADLLCEQSMPPVLLEVYTHAAWDEIHAEGPDNRVEPPPSPFPASAVRAYARERFDALKREQTRLLGRRRRP